MKLAWPTSTSWFWYCEENIKPVDTSYPRRKRALMENPIMRTWRKMKSFGHTSSSTTASIKKSKSWHGSAFLEDATENESKGKIKKESPPHGFFTVYVGSTKQRIFVKTKLVNHPLFKNLLEDAETEYGYRRDGPIVLPCEVDIFFKVLADMKSYDGHDDDYDDDGLINPPICGLGSPYRSCGSTDSMGMRRNGSYKLLRTPSLFKLNRFWFSFFFLIYFLHYIDWVLVHNITMYFFFLLEWKYEEEKNSLLKVWNNLLEKRFSFCFSKILMSAYIIFHTLLLLISDLYLNLQIHVRVCGWVDFWVKEITKSDKFY